MMTRNPDEHVSEAGRRRERVVRTEAYSSEPPRDPTPDFQQGSDTGGVQCDATQGAPTRRKIRAALAPPGEPSGLFGQYRIVDRLGRGGMGTVYRAVHQRLGKVVALKLLAPELLRNSASIKRFQREMLASGRLEHPNIVEAFDAGEVDGRHYLAMEYVGGLDLAELLRRHGAPGVGVAEACELIRQAANGLKYAHDRGMVHRDIKLSNLILAAAEESGGPVVKILDFGLARLTDAPQQSEELTATGQLMGTFEYMAPEQGQGDRADERADIYALGVSLFRLLTGRFPFSSAEFATPVQLMVHKATHSAPSVGAVRGDLPPGLIAVVDRMLNQKPQGRFRHAGQVAEALAPFTKDANLSCLLTSCGEATAEVAVDEWPLTTDVPLSTVGEGGGARPREFGSEAPSPRPRAVRLARSREVVRRRKSWLVAAAALGVFVALSLGVIVRYMTNYGALIVELDDASVELTIKQRGVVVYDKTTDRRFDLRALPGEIEVYDRPGNLRLLTREFSLARGGKTYVRITLDELSQARDSRSEPTRRPEGGAAVHTDSAPSRPAGIESVRAMLAEDNPWFRGSLAHRTKAGKVVQLKLPPPPRTETWNLACLARVSSLRELDMQGCDAATFLSLANLALHEVRLDVELYNEPVVNALKRMPSLQRINGVATDEFWQTRAAHRAEIERFHRRLASLPVEEQVAFILRKLRELNPRYRGTLRHVAEQNRLTLIDISHSEVFDLAPLRGTRLIYLVAHHTPIADLSALQGLPLVTANLTHTRVTGLASLRGMPLTKLYIGETRVSDLKPLAGMPLVDIGCSDTRVRDLTPLRGMQLTIANFSRSRVIDLSVLSGMPLEELYLRETEVKDLRPLQDAPLKILTIPTAIRQHNGELLSSIRTLRTINGRPATAGRKK